MIEITDTSSLSAGTRVYYFDKRVGNGGEYLTITEINAYTKRRQCIFVHPEHLQEFAAKLAEIIAKFQP